MRGELTPCPTVPPALCINVPDGRQLVHKYIFTLWHQKSSSPTLCSPLYIHSCSITISKPFFSFKIDVTRRAWKQIVMSYYLTIKVKPIKVPMRTNTWKFGQKQFTKTVDCFWLNENWTFSQQLRVAQSNFSNWITEFWLFLKLTV